MKKLITDNYIKLRNTFITNNESSDEDLFHDSILKANESDLNTIDELISFIDQYIKITAFRNRHKEYLFTPIEYANINI